MANVYVTASKLFELNSLEITFGESFLGCKKVFTLDEDDVKDAIMNPDKSQKLCFEDLIVTAYSKLEVRSGTYLVVLGELISGTYNVKYVFRIFPSRIGNIIDNEPFTLLQQLALFFGLPVKILNTADFHL